MSVEAQLQAQPSDMVQTILTDRARQIYADARDHKRAATAHRREAKRLQREYARLLAACRELGFQVIVEGTDGKESQP
jgi:hypothetical protein